MALKDWIKFRKNKPQRKYQESIYEKRNKEELEFAQSQEEKYTLENQDRYIERLEIMFRDGEINSQNIEEIKRELYNYPDRIKSVMFITEMYYLITENEQTSIAEIDKYLNSIKGLSTSEYEALEEKKEDFRQRIKLTEHVDERYIKEKQDKLAQQRQYLKQIASDLKEGRIKTENVQEIINKLHQCEDMERAMFLAIEVAREFYDKKDLLQLLNVYSLFPDLSDAQRKFIVTTRIQAYEDKRPEKKSVKRDRKLKEKAKKLAKKEKLAKKVQKDKIIEALKQGKSVKDIYTQMIGTTLKSITKIKASLVKKDDEFAQSQEEDMEIVRLFIEDGYTVEQIYELLEYNIPVNKILEMQRSMQEEIQQSI